MKAPDKIFLSVEMGEKWDYAIWSDKNPNEQMFSALDDHEEYIRKDALLDLVSKKKAQFIANGWPKKFLAGFDIMCDELIAELKSL